MPQDSGVDVNYKGLWKMSHTLHLTIHKPSLN